MKSGPSCLLSGGLDSATVLAIVAADDFNFRAEHHYGQRHARRIHPRPGRGFSWRASAPRHEGGSRRCRRFGANG